MFSITRVQRQTLLVLCMLGLLYLSFNEELRSFYSRSTVEEFNPNGLLTLFTTFSNNTNRSMIESNTIKNWAWVSQQSGDDMKCICFYTNNSLKTINDEVDVNPYWSRSPITNTYYGLPVVKNMYLEVQKSADTSYIGFSNSDILYDNLLLKSIRAVHDFHNQTYSFNSSLLIVGQRTDVNITTIGMDVTDDYRIGSLKNEGLTCRTDTIDYFIVNTRGYPWDNFLDVVVARTAWDNYMISYARDENVIVYDISKTVHAVHQSYSGHKNRGSQASHPDLNKDLLSKADLFIHAAKIGNTRNTQFYTEFKGYEIIVKMR